MKTLGKEIMSELLKQIQFIELSFLERILKIRNSVCNKWTEQKKNDNKHNKIIFLSLRDLSTLKCRKNVKQQKSQRE